MAAKLRLKTSAGADLSGALSFSTDPGTASAAQTFRVLNDDSAGAVRRRDGTGDRCPPSRSEQLRGPA